MRTPLFLFLLLLPFMAMGQAENCFNGIDDDGDGKIDLNDGDCHCGSGTSIPSIIPNPSFEVKSDCPSGFSELYKALPWEQATNATTDFFHKCGFMMPAITPDQQDFPDGEGIAGALYLRDWNEYMGAPLLAPMTAGTSYQLTFNIAALKVHGDGTATGSSVSTLEPVSVTLYGCANATLLPINTVYSPDTYSPEWVELGNVEYVPSQDWEVITIPFTAPFDVKAIMMGPPKVLPASYPSTSGGDFPYFLYDNLLLNTAAAFGVNVGQSGTFCEENLILLAAPTVPLSPGATYQWYRNGIAITGATGPQYNVPANPIYLGYYQVRVTDGGACYNSPKRTINNLIASPEVSAIQPTCVIPTGTITVVTPAAQYSFDNGVTWQASPTKTGVALGTHYVKIKTANGCVSSVKGVTISEPVLLWASDVTTEQPEDCTDTGKITVNATTAIEYSFDNGLTWTNANVADNLDPGEYAVKVKDALGCESGKVSVFINRIYLDTPDITIVQPGCTTNGTITITTAAAEYSFDDGATWTTNPVATNLPPGAYAVQIRENPHCTSFSHYLYLHEYVEYTPLDYTTVSPICGAGGSITITTPSTAYSFDGGTTWQTGNTLTGLAPGSYALQIKTASGCNSQKVWMWLWEEFKVPVYSITHPFCKETTGSITVQPEPGWQYSFDGGLTFQASNESGPLLPGSYAIVLTDGAGCLSQVAYVYINDPSGIPPAPTGDFAQLFCVHNAPTVAFLQAEGPNIRWYDTPGSPTPLSPALPLVDGTTYYATQTGDNHCESQTFLAVTVSIVNAPIPAHAYATPVCDDLNDGRETIDLFDYADRLIDHPEDYTFAFYTTFDAANTVRTGNADRITNPSSYDLAQQVDITLYVRVIAANQCWEVVPLTLQPVASPVLEMKDHYYLCEGKTVTLHADPGFNTYRWSTGQDTSRIVVASPGTYTVTIGRYHGPVTCTTTLPVVVELSAPATITRIDVSDWTDRDNSLQIVVDGPGDYEYSLDGEHFQADPSFTGLLSGFYDVYVRDRNGCGTVQGETCLLMYPNFFTPNGDGANDSWSIRFASAERLLEVKIFSRDGKFLRQLKHGEQWDGTYNGRPLPSDDYWFLVMREDGRQHRGHFALKR